MRSVSSNPLEEPDMPDAGPGKDRQYVTALARGLEVLRCFTPATPLLGTTEIARITQLPQPTVWRLCYTLMQEGYLVQSDRGDKLRLGIPVLSLGYAVIASTPIAELAREDMQAIAMRHQNAVSLGVLDGTGVIYVQRCHGLLVVLPHLTVGSRVDVATSAIGWAFLASMETKERKALVQDLSKAEGATWPGVRKEFEQALRTYEQTGYIVRRGYMGGQINAVAVPIVAEDGSVPFALSSGGIAQLFDEAKLAQVGELLKVLAARLQPALKVPR